MATLERMAALRSKGGMVIATRRLPSLAPGLKDEGENAQIRALGQSVFTHFVQDEQTLGSTLKQMLTPDFAVQSGNAAIGFVHRRLENAGDIYFVVNTSNQPVDTHASIRVTGVSGECWDPFTGEAKPLFGSSDGKFTTVELRLAPYESQVMMFRPGTLEHEKGRIDTGGGEIDISGDWRVTFEGLKQTQAMPQLKSWTDNPQTKYYSGKAVYEKTVDVSESLLKGATAIDFGKGEPVLRAEMPNGMRALLESPVRESALVYVNGKLAGSVWHPPYTLRVGKYLHAGQNQFRVVVANLAINEMAGKALPTYTLLKDRYGDRFQPQGFENFHALPAGMLGPVQLVASEEGVPAQSTVAQGPDPSASRLPKNKLPARPELPTLYIVGDSTVRNGQGDGKNGQWGWGDLIGVYFDPSKINVVNWALGGRSSRTFISEGHWQQVVNALKPGDFVMVQFGHNDGGAVNDNSRARGSIKGTGDESQEIDNMITHKHETVHTFGWYMREYVTDTRAKGATPIICTMIPRKIWKDGKIVTNTGDYAGWAEQVATHEHAPLVDLNEIIAEHYDVMGPEKVNPLFGDEHTHTTLAGAEINAEAVIEGLKALKNDPLKPYFSERAQAVEPAVVAR